MRESEVFQGNATDVHSLATRQAVTEVCEALEHTQICEPALNRKLVPNEPGIPGSIPIPARLRLDERCGGEESRDSRCKICAESLGELVGLHRSNCPCPTLNGHHVIKPASHRTTQRPIRFLRWPRSTLAVNKVLIIRVPGFFFPAQQMQIFILCRTTVACFTKFIHFSKTRQSLGSKLIYVCMPPT